MHKTVVHQSSYVTESISLLPPKRGGGNCFVFLLTSVFWQIVSRWEEFQGLTQLKTTGTWTSYRWINMHCMFYFLHTQIEPSGRQLVWRMWALELHNSNAVLHSAIYYLCNLGRSLHFVKFCLSLLQNRGNCCIQLYKKLNRNLYIKLTGHSKASET